MNQLGNNWRVLYHKEVVKADIPKIAKVGRVESARIKKAIENRIMVDPVLYGLPLRGTLKRYWKLRVGDWRIVYTIVRRDVIILVIAHRRYVYEVAESRKLG